MELPQRSYSAKVMLFGEHTVVLGGDALAIPFSKYTCNWNAQSQQLELWWQAFIDYLVEECHEFLSQERLNGIRAFTPLSWNIPVGYGLGSSGAITAAIYDYSHKAVEKDLGVIQALLGKMESYFHGKSSGYDPLISYVNSGIYKSDTTRSTWTYDLGPKLHCYLLDSGVPRSGKDLIQEFGSRAKMYPEVHQVIMDLNNKIITSLVDDDQIFNFDALNELSRLQNQYMDYMIVDSIREMWQESLKSNDLAIKICGAGGGGYYLAWSKEPIEHLGTYSLLEVK